MITPTLAVIGGSGFYEFLDDPREVGEIGRANGWNPVTDVTRMPSSA